MRDSSSGMNPLDPDAPWALLLTGPGIPQEMVGLRAFWDAADGFPGAFLVWNTPTWSLPRSPAADGTRLRSRSSARCRSTGAVLTDSSVQSAMAKVVNRAEAWADTHWMIYWTRKVAKTTPMPAQESWSHQGSLGLVSLVGGSPTRTSTMSCDSVTALWSVDGATLGGWSIIPALPA